MNYRVWIAALVGSVASLSLSAHAGPIFDSASIFEDSTLVVDVENDLQIGDLVYTDRDYTFTSIPSFLRGLEWLQTPNDAKNISGGGSLTFTTLTSFDFSYVWIDDRKTDLAALFASVDTGFNLMTAEGNNTQTYSIYSFGPAPAGGPYLGFSQSGASFYGVAAGKVPVPGGLALIAIGLAVGARRWGRR